MAERKYTHGLQLSWDDDVIVVSIGKMEIWDGADLSLLRDTLNDLACGQGCGIIGVDMQFVQYVPSGFFGMLFDWFEAGIEVRLVRPRERVQNMLWFRKFFQQMDSGMFGLHEGCGVNEAAAENLWPREIPTGEKDAVASLVG